MKPIESARAFATEDEAIADMLRTHGSSIGIILHQEHCAFRSGGEGDCDCEPTIVQPGGDS